MQNFGKHYLRATAAATVEFAAIIVKQFAETKEVSRETTGKDGYYYGYGLFKVLSYEVAFNKGKDCPWSWDIDFKISGGKMDTSPVSDSATGFVPSPTKIGSARPDPNAWDNWSDRVITATNTVES